MFKTMKQLFTPTNKDLRHRIYFTFLVLAIFIIGCSIRVPGTENVSNNLGFLELLNSMGGGAFKKFSIFALGVMPYITASIIMQLLEMDIFPYFADLRWLFFLLALRRLHHSSHALHKDQRLLTHLRRHLIDLSRDLLGLLLLFL